MRKIKIIVKQSIQSTAIFNFATVFKPDRKMQQVSEFDVAKFVSVSGHRPQQIIRFVCKKLEEGSENYDLKIRILF